MGKKSDQYQNCTDDKRSKGSKPCVMDLSALGPCYDDSSNFKYGYDEQKPCIFMKMNRVGCNCFLLCNVHRVLITVKITETLF